MQQQIRNNLVTKRNGNGFAPSLFLLICNIRFCVFYQPVQKLLHFIFIVLGKCIVQLFQLAQKIPLVFPEYAVPFGGFRNGPVNKTVYGFTVAFGVGFNSVFLSMSITIAIMTVIYSGPRKERPASFHPAPEGSGRRHLPTPSGGRSGLAPAGRWECSRSESRTREIPA